MKGGQDLPSKAVIGVGPEMGSGCCHLREVHIGNLFCKRSNEDKHVFDGRKGKQEGLWYLEVV